MADTTAAAGLEVQQWDDNFFMEYLNGNRYTPYMGTAETDIIQVKEDLTKKKGDTITYAFVNRLSNAAVTGSSTLEGNEEAMDSRSHTLTVNKRRNAVRVAEMEEQQSAIPLRTAAKPVLLDWAMEDTRDLVIDALQSINGVNYSAATQASLDGWALNNSDRVIYGVAKSNLTGDHSVDIVKVSAVTDIITPGAISVVKRMAETASPKIRPVNVGGDRRFYVCFTNSNTFRDLKNNATITAAQREVGLQAQNNRLFQGGDIIWDGMLIREDPDLPTYTSGSAGIEVGQFFLCGAQALAMGWAKRWRTVTENFDYGDKQGVAVESIFAINKMIFGTDGSVDTTTPKDHGIATAWFPAVADS